jgi:hypothetical protein
MIPKTVGAIDYNNYTMSGGMDRNITIWFFYVLSKLKTKIYFFRDGDGKILRILSGHTNNIKFLT